MPFDDSPFASEQSAESLTPPQPARTAAEQVVARSESSLREQRAELARMTAEVRQLYQTARNQRSQEAVTLRREKEQLERTLAERDQELTTTREQAEAAKAQYQQELTEARERAEAAEAQRQQELAEAQGQAEAAEAQFRRQLADARQRAETAEAQLREMEQVQQQLIVESEAALSEQRAELARLMTELREVCQLGLVPAESFDEAPVREDGQPA